MTQTKAFYLIASNSPEGEHRTKEASEHSGTKRRERPWTNAAYFFFAAFPSEAAMRSLVRSTPSEAMCLSERNNTNVSLRYAVSVAKKVRN